MKRIRLACLVPVLVVAFAGPAFAQQEPPEQPVAVFGIGGVLVQRIIRGPSDPGPVNNCQSGNW